MTSECWVGPLKLILRDFNNSKIFRWTRKNEYLCAKMQNSGNFQLNSFKNDFKDFGLAFGIVFLPEIPISNSDLWLLSWKLNIVIKKSFIFGLFANLIPLLKFYVCLIPHSFIQVLMALWSIVSTRKEGTAKTSNWSTYLTNFSKVFSNFLF
jgi:hypothetical protein